MRIRSASSAPTVLPTRSPSRRNAGFTLVELLTVITILAIMAALSAPSMTRLIADQRLKSTATDLHLTLLKARSEAIKRNADVTVSPTGGDWTAGWSVLDPQAPSGPALDVRGPVASVSVTTTATQVVYRGTGRITPAGEVMFVFTSTRTDAARCLSIDPSGRPYLKEGSSC